MSLRREQLLGYLLGALEPEERAEVERELAANPRLGQELAEIRDVLEQVGMTERPEPIEPPAGLVDRTCDLVAAQSADPVPVGLPPDRSAGGSVRYYTLTDVLVAASVLLALTALLFPSLSHSRFMARLVTCQNNLRQVGLALWQDSELRPDHSYPRLPWRNQRTVAGLMAPILMERQALTDREAILCPASLTPPLSPERRFPTTQQILSASGQELHELQRLAGGNLAWPIGFVQDGQFVPAQNEYRENFCLVAEAPIITVSRGVQPGHEGIGANLFFEDGHIRFIRGIAYISLPDHPYRNRQGEAAFGVDGDDSVLGPSDMRPRAVIVPVNR